MEIINLNLGEIHPYEKNPRNNDGAVDAVAASIKEFGFKVPIIIDNENVIVCGHTRYKAAKKLGKEKCDDYGLEFNSLEFYKWCKEQPYQVFFSSYEISDDSFYKVKIKSVMSLIGANTNGQKVNEYLYSNMPIREEQYETSNGSN